MWQTSQRGRTVRLARLGQRLCCLTRGSLGYFVEEIASPQQAMEVAVYFHDGVVLLESSDTRALILASRESEAGQVMGEPEGSLLPESAFDPRRNAYSVSFAVYEDGKVVRLRYLITRDGLIGFAQQVLVQGPVAMAGWDAPDESMRAYARRTEAFENAVEAPVTSAAVRLVKKESLSEQGLLRARENALRWLLDKESRLELHAAVIQDVIAADDGSIDEGLAREATSKLKALGRGQPSGTR